MEDLHTFRPQHLWISTPCGPYSIVQNANQRSPEQTWGLMVKRRRATRIYLNATKLARKQHEMGGRVYWAWPL
eukprot:11182561-Lingulodinium_polyedra.AAC.1